MLIGLPVTPGHLCPRPQKRLLRDSSPTPDSQGETSYQLGYDYPSG